MALTLAKNQEQYIVRSLYDYVTTNIATAYNAAVASTDYSTPLGLALEWPDNPDLTPMVPLIIFDSPVDIAPQKSGGMGDGTVFKYKQFHLYCFPALTSEGKPSLEAASVLRTYTDIALGTGLYIPINDYSQSPAPEIDIMRVTDSRQMKGFPTFAPLLSPEKHRYDYLLCVEYMVEAIHG